MNNFLWKVLQPSDTSKYIFNMNTIVSRTQWFLVWITLRESVCLSMCHWFTRFSNMVGHFPDRLHLSRLLFQLDFFSRVLNKIKTKCRDCWCQKNVIYFINNLDGNNFISEATENCVCKAVFYLQKETNRTIKISPLCTFRDLGKKTLAQGQVRWALA